MQIMVKNLAKQFGREWIFKNLDFEFSSNQSYAIIGNNGSGKSTLLKVLAGVMPTTQGEIKYITDKAKEIKAEDWFNHLAIATPYLELIEEFSLEETIDFYTSFKRLTISKKDLIKRLEFQKNKHKQVRFFSSGMKQKLKLGLAMFSDVKVLLLDEPTSNLDEANISWYLFHIKNVLRDRLTIICSNQPIEYNFCNQNIDLMLLK
jgi:ABC-type multidrug transport system ATPase subunit